MNMPKGANNKFAHNKGFAYVDFEDPVGVIAAVGLSEQNLDGRRLLIKDAKSYEGRPKSAATEAVQQALQQSTSMEAHSGTPDAVAGEAVEAGPSKIPVSLPVKTLSKTARRILDRQKNVPAPTLFLGNLGFEVTVSPPKYDHEVTPTHADMPPIARHRAKLFRSYLKRTSNQPKPGPRRRSTRSARREATRARLRRQATIATRRLAM